MSNKLLGDCATILLDTGVIMEALMPRISTDRQRLINNLLKHLSQTKTKKNLVRRFYISDISISEIANISTVNSAIARLHPVLKVSNLTLAAFDTDIAEYISNNFADLLPEKVLNQISLNHGYKSHELQLAREWITRDMMIVATGKIYDVDLILTTEKNTGENKATFRGLAEKAGVFCVPTYKDYFLESQGDELIMEFDLNKIKSPKLDLSKTRLENEEQ